MQVHLARRGPLASPLDQQDLQYHFDVCREKSSPRTAATYRQSPVLYYQSSRRNRTYIRVRVDPPSVAHRTLGQSAALRSIARTVQAGFFWCRAGTKLFFQLVAACLAIRIFTELLLPVSQPKLHLSASEVIRRIPLPLSSRHTLHQTSPYCDPSKSTQTTAAVLQFVFDHIQYASSAATLSSSLSMSLGGLLYYQVHHITTRSYAAEQSFILDMNLTDLVPTPLIDFTSGGFIGKTLAYALDELDHLTSRCSPPLMDQEIRALAIYHQTASNLLLEYSAVRPHVTRLLAEASEAHRHLSFGIQQPDRIVRRTRNSVRERTSHRHAPEVVSDTLKTNLEDVVDGLYLLVRHLDWVTELLARSNVPIKSKSSHQIDLSSSLNALQDLFYRSHATSPRKPCSYLEQVPSNASKQERLTVAGSPTVSAGW